MNDFNWRNQPRTTKNDRPINAVVNPAPITFNGTPLSGTMDKPLTKRINKPKPKAAP